MFGLSTRTRYPKTAVYGPFRKGVVILEFDQL